MAPIPEYLPLNRLKKTKGQPHFQDRKLGGAGKDPGIGGSRAQQTPKNLGCYKINDDQIMHNVGNRLELRARL